MGLFGSIGKVFGGAIKVVGKVASVASAVAPVPGLGFAGKVAGGLGGLLAKAKKTQHLVQSVASGGALKPGVLASMSPVMPGGAILTAGGAVGGLKAISKAMGKRKKRRPARAAGSRRRKRRRSGRRGLSRAQLRAGFGGKRRMRA